MWLLCHQHHRLTALRRRMRPGDLALGLGRSLRLGIGLRRELGEGLAHPCLRRHLGQHVRLHRRLGHRDGSRLHHGRGDRRLAGVKHDTIRQMAVGPDPDQRLVIACGRDGLRNRRRRPNEIGGEQQCEQRSADEHEIAKDGHWHAPPPASPRGLFALTGDPLIGSCALPNGSNGYAKFFGQGATTVTFPLAECAALYTRRAVTSEHVAWSAFTLTKPTGTRAKVLRLFMLTSSASTRLRSVRWLPSRRAKAQTISTSFTA